MSNCNNSVFLFERLYNPETTFETCPPDVTRDMLLKELMCKDLQCMGDEIIENTNKLWKIFYYNNRSSNSPFGFTFLGDEEAIPIATQPLPTRTSTSRMKRKTNTKRTGDVSKRRSSTKRGNVLNNENKISTQPSNKKKSGFFNLFGKTDTRKQRRNRMFGGNARYDENRNTYVTLLNESMEETMNGINTDAFANLAPVWRFNVNGIPLHTLSKLKPIDRIPTRNSHDIPIYVYATSLPIKDTFEYPKSLGNKQYCANTLFFYKFARNISRIISLHGCGLNWDLITLPNNIPLPFKPNHCQDLDEKRNWDNVSKSNDSRYDDTQSSLLEYYWVDMTSGFFNTYKSIVSLDFTDPNTKTIIHCMAGFGRTGSILLMILCKYFFSSSNGKQNFSRLFNKTLISLEDRRKQSFNMCSLLRSILVRHLELDTLSDDTIGLNENCIKEINTSIEKFDISCIIYELLYGFFDEINPNTKEVQISVTLMNMLITRINYIIYFTAYVNDIAQVNLYQIHDMNTLGPHLPFINSGNIFEFLLLNPLQVHVKPFTRSLNHPTTNMYFGINTIQPQNRYIPPQQIVDNSDNPTGDERLSARQDIPTPDERPSTITSQPNYNVTSQPVISPASRNRRRNQPLTEQINNSTFYDIPI